MYDKNLTLSSLTVLSFIYVNTNSVKVLWFLILNLVHYDQLPCIQKLHPPCFYYMSIYSTVFNAQHLHLTSLITRRYHRH